jgi:hypothetical protein
MHRAAKLYVAGLGVAGLDVAGLGVAGHKGLGENVVGRVLQVQRYLNLLLRTSRKLDS